MSKDHNNKTGKVGAADLHGFDDRNDACWPEAADGGQHGDGQVVVRRSTIHQGDAWRYLHGMNLAWWDRWVPSTSRQVGLTLKKRQQDDKERTNIKILDVWYRNLGYVHSIKAG